MHKTELAESAHRISAFRVTKHGVSQCFMTGDAPELLMAGIRLREHFQKEKSAPSTFATAFLHSEEITPGEFDDFTKVRMDNTGQIAGVYDLNFDKREFSAVHIMDGWKTYSMGDISTAAYHATRKLGLTTDQRWERFLNHLDGKEITSAGHLSSRNISFADEIVADDGKLNFYMDCAFDADAVFGTNVCTSENDDYLNIYADYDKERQRVCDELNIVLWKGDGETEEMSYALNAAEKEVLLQKMDAYCMEQTGRTLADYSAQWMADEQTPCSGPTM